MAVLRIPIANHSYLDTVLGESNTSTLNCFYKRGPATRRIFLFPSSRINMKDWLNGWYKLNEFLIIKNTHRTTARDDEQTVAFKVPCLFNPEDWRIIPTWELELEFRCLVKRHFRAVIPLFLAPTRWVSMTMCPSSFFFFIAKCHRHCDGVNCCHLSSRISSLNMTFRSSRFISFLSFLYQRINNTNINLPFLCLCEELFGYHFLGVNFSHFSKNLITCLGYNVSVGIFRTGPGLISGTRPFYYTTSLQHSL